MRLMAALAGQLVFGAAHQTERLPHPLDGGDEPIRRLDTAPVEGEGGERKDED